MIFLFEKIRAFWAAFWAYYRGAVGKEYKDPPKELTQDYRDTDRTNLLSIFVTKIVNLVCNEATVSVESNSTVIEPLTDLAHDLEKSKYEIATEMTAVGDYWVFPATDSAGNLYHRYLTQQEVRILNTEADKLTDIIGVIDKYTDSNDNTYFLVRRHTLEGNTLTVETYTTDTHYARTYLERWASLESSYTLYGAGTIGVGRFKSPTSSRGKSPIYGVPLNYGCKEIEDKIFLDLQQLDDEYALGQSILFADINILLKDEEAAKNSAKWKITERIFPIERRSGDTAPAFDVKSPPIRYQELSQKIEFDMRQFEQVVGADRGFLTPFETGTATTATEIKRANASTIALIEKMRNAMSAGIEMTLQADALFLNIPANAYQVKIDWFDVFEDYTAQYQRLKDAVADGMAEETDLMQWIFPNYTLDELQEKLDRIQAKKDANNPLLNGQISQNDTLISDDENTEEDEIDKKSDKKEPESEEK